MRNEVSVGGITAKPGTIAKGLWKISELYDGSSVEIPVAVINGSEDGAILWAQSSVHGDEYVGTHAIQRLLLQVDPKEMKGAIIAIPWLNVLAYRWGTRGAPQDGMDMNRIWPGKPLDTAMHIFAHSELVVHEVFSEMRRLADVVMDLHDGGWMGRMSAYIQYFYGVSHLEASAKARAIAEASGMDILWESPADFVDEKAPGSVGTATMGLDIPTLTMEIGGEGRCPEHDVTRMYLGLTNVATHLGILPGQLVCHPGAMKTKLYVRKGHWLRPKHGGSFIPKVQVAEIVSGGDVVAEIRDAFGELVEEILAPTDGVVIGMRTYGTIATGQYAGNVSELVPSLD